MPSDRRLAEIDLARLEAVLGGEGGNPAFRQTADFHLRDYLEQNCPKPRTGFLATIWPNSPPSAECTARQVELKWREKMRATPWSQGGWNLRLP